MSVPQTGERALAAGPGERSVGVCVGDANVLASRVSVPQTGERALAAGPGERSVGVCVGDANVLASRVSVPQTGERALAAGPGERSVGVCVGDANVPVAPLGSPLSTGRVAAAVAMPLTDLTALAAAAAVAVAAGGLSGWLVAGYATAVFLVLSAIGLQRLRICLRVCDQSGRIVVAAAVPALALAPWITAAHAVVLAVGTAGLLLATRMTASAVLRSAHRQGRLTERAVLVGPASGPAAGHAAG